MNSTNGWRRVKLKDVCQKITVGHVGPMAKEYVDDGIPFLRSQNIEPFRLNLSSVKYITPQFHARLKKSALAPGDVAVVRTGYPGTACVIPGELPVSNCADLVIIRPSNVLDAKYLAALFNSTWGQGSIAGTLVGVAQQHFNVGAAKGMVIDLPPLPTQQKIASVLSAYDDLIENNTRRIKILEEMAQAIYREWFVNFRSPGHEKARMVNSELGPIPEGWETKRLGDVASVYRGRSYRSADIVEEGGLPFLNLKCVDRDGGFRREGIRRYQGPYKETQTAKSGDIIMAVTDMTQERRIIARAARVPVMGQSTSVFSMDLVKIQPNSRAAQEYLYGMLRFSAFPDEVKQHANGANVLHLNPAHIEGYKFVLPPVALSNQYAEICSRISRQSDLLNLKNDNLRQTRDLLLPKLVSGEVDVTELDLASETIGIGK